MNNDDETIYNNDDFIQKHITPQRLNSPYLFRTKLGFFSRRSRPITSTENYFAQIWNQPNSSFELATLIHVFLQPKEIVSWHASLGKHKEPQSYKRYGLKTSTSDEIRQGCLHFFKISQSLSPKSAKCVCSLFDRQRSSSGY